MIIMDFTTTAMARPDIVDQTYASFSENLDGIDLKQCGLFINVDPIPSDVDRMEVIKVAKKYFGEVHYNFPNRPNYTRAYNWIWSNARTKYIFNLEDDWGLLEEVSVPYLLEYFGEYPDLMEVALRAYTYSYKACPTSPSIMHERYYKAVAGKLDEKFNPECQLRGKNFGIEMPARSLGVSPKGKIIAYPDKRVILKDLGRNWLERSKFAKPNVSKKYFTSWVVKDKDHLDELTVLANKFECDKGSINRNYTKIYNNYFYPIRNDQFNMLEIGLYKGASAKMWTTYFQNTILYSIDIIKGVPKDKRLKVLVNTGRLKYFRADQTSVNEMSKMFDGDKVVRFKIIVDDASHMAEDQQYSFGYLFPFLLDGGLYIIEDLHYRRKHNNKFKVRADNTIDVFKRYKQTGNFESKVLIPDQLEYINMCIDKVDIYDDKIVFIRKKEMK